MDTGKMNTSVTKINNMNFDNHWKGTAYETQSEQLTNTMNDLNKCINDVNDFNKILEKRTEYEEVCARIMALYKAIAGCSADHDDPDSHCNCGAYYNEIAALEKKREAIRNEIIGLLGKFAGIDPEILPPADLSKAAQGILTFEEQLELIEQYSRMPAGNIAKNLEGKVDENGVLIEDGAAYIQERIDSIKSQYTGTERNYYVAMEVIEISLLAGVRSPYEHNGTTGDTIYTHNPVSTEWLSKGIDCNAYVSMVIYDDESTEKWLRVEQYKYAGTSVDTYEEAQPGDIFANGGHVGIIMANDPVSKQLIINHASGQDPDMKYEVISYDTLEQRGNVIRRVDRNYVTPEVQEYLDKNQN